MMDLFHMNIEEITFEEGFKNAGDRLFHVHIADSNRHYPGSGHLDFDSAFRALAGMGYQGYVSAELMPVPDADTAGIKTMEFLKRYI
jgi:sugar phosphate isomerase/epimerase